MRRNKRKNLIFSLVFIILFMGLGYAFISSTLSINGTAKFQEATWDVHFDEAFALNKDGEIDDGLTDELGLVIDNALTTVYYNVEFYEPGDYYEIGVCVVNMGTIDAMLESFDSKINGISVSNLPSYIDYSVTYMDGEEIKENHLLEAGYQEFFKIRIGYRKDIEISDLPSSLQTPTFSFEVVYIQADKNVAVDRTTRIEYLAPEYDEFSNSVTMIHSTEESDMNNYPFFVKKTYIKEVFRASSVGFRYGGELYYITNLTDYEEAKSFVTNLIGEENCHFLGNGPSYFCSFHDYDIKINQGNNFDDDYCGIGIENDYIVCEFQGCSGHIN